MDRKHKQTKPTQAQRAAQSRRDKHKNNKGIGSRNGKRIFGPARPPGRGRRGRTVVQGSNQPSEVTTISSAYTASDQGMGEIKTATAPPAEDYSGGTRLYGCDMLAPIGTNNTDFKVFGTPTGSQVLPYDGSVIPTFPGNSERLMSIATNFTKWVYRELCIEYRPMVGTQNDGGFAIGWQPDADLFKITNTTYTEPTFQQVLSLPNSMVMPFWKPSCFAIKLLSNLLRYVDCKLGSGVQNGPGAFRQVTQGSYTAVGAQIPTTGKSMGYVCVKYVIDLYGAAPAGMADLQTSLSTKLRLAGYTPAQIKAVLALRSAPVLRAPEEQKRSSSKARSEVTLDSDGDWNMSHD